MKYSLVYSLFILSLLCSCKDKNQADIREFQVNLEQNRFMLKCEVFHPNHYFYKDSEIEHDYNSESLRAPSTNYIAAKNKFCNKIQKFPTMKDCINFSYEFICDSQQIKIAFLYKKEVLNIPEATEDLDFYYSTGILFCDELNNNCKIRWQIRSEETNNETGGCSFDITSIEVSNNTAIIHYRSICYEDDQIKLETFKFYPPHPKAKSDNESQNWDAGNN